MRKLISIIIATYNRGKSLAQTLDDILLLEIGDTFDYEVIVVDNNSTDDTRKVVDDQLSTWGGRLRYFFEPTPGKSYALNKGVQEARGEILAFTDDDVELEATWLSELVKCFEQYQCDGVGGRVLPIYPADTPQWIKANAVQMAGAVVIYEYGDAVKPLAKTMYPFIGANYAFRRQMFSEYGLFREDLGPGAPAMGEDTELVERLLTKGKRLYYCGKALVHHPYDPKRMNWRQLARWHMAIGRFDAQREIQSGEAFVYYFGIPRYLFKGIMVDLGRLSINCFNRLGIWNAWRSFFRKAGMIQQYRLYRAQSKER